MGGWIIEWCEIIKNEAISAFNYVEAEFGKIVIIFNWFLNWIRQQKYLQKNIDLASLKKFLSKDDPSKSPNSKSSYSLPPTGKENYV